MPTSVSSTSTPCPHPPNQERTCAPLRKTYSQLTNKRLNHTKKEHLLTTDHAKNKYLLHLPLSAIYTSQITLLQHLHHHEFLIPPSTKKNHSGPQPLHHNEQPRPYTKIHLSPLTTSNTIFLTKHY